MAFPILRFKEFEGDWKGSSMKELTKINQGLQIPIADRLLEEEEGSYFYITNEFLRVGSQSKYYIKNPSKSVICNESDVLMTRTGNTGQVVTGVKGAFHNNFFKIAFESDVLDRKFLVEFLRLSETQNMILRYAGTSTIPDLNHGDFYRLKINLPSLPEQRKIADFLSAVDEKIRLLTEKKEKLETYKKGVMQKLFPKHGQTNPELRFKRPDGTAFPDWEEKRLGEVLDFYGTNSLSRSLLNYEAGDIKNIHYGDIHTKFKSNFRLGQEEVPFINQDVDTSKIKLDQFCQEGDLVIADASEDYKDIGKAIELIDLCDEPVVAGLHTYIARDSANYFSLGFKGYLFQTEPIRRQIMRLATGVSVLGISKTNLSKMELKLPSIEEQTIIVDFLTALDTKILGLDVEIDQMKDFKKGLLQQMFV